MIETGLVSITFRQLSPEQIVSLVLQAGLDAIEWGGDVHVPHGDVKTAEHVRDITVAAGLDVAAYGSYYRVGVKEGPTFDEVLSCAAALGTKMIRVWAGRKGSEIADAAYRQMVVDDARRIADMAGEKEIVVVSEWHGNSLTDTLDSALDFFAEVNHQNFRSYWQPLVDRPIETCLFEIESVMPYFAGMHVFAWKGVERLELAEHRDRWGQYFAKAKSAGDFPALLEFVQADSPDAFIHDAAILKEIVSEI